MRKLLIILVLIASDALAQMYGTNYVAVMFDRQNEVFYPGKASEFVTNNAVIKALRMEDAALGAGLFEAARDISEMRRAMMPRSASESGELDFSYADGVVNIRAAHIDGLFGEIMFDRVPHVGAATNPVLTKADMSILDERIDTIADGLGATSNAFRTKTIDVRFDPGESVSVPGFVSAVHSDVMSDVELVATLDTNFPASRIMMESWRGGTTSITTDSENGLRGVFNAMPGPNVTNGYCFVTEGGDTCWITSWDPDTLTAVFTPALQPDTIYAIADIRPAALGTGLHYGSPVHGSMNVEAIIGWPVSAPPAMATKDGRIVYYAPHGANVLYKSVDGARSSYVIHTPNITGGYPRLATHDGKMLFFIRGNSLTIFMSEDGGETWAAVAQAPASTGNSGDLKTPDGVTLFFTTGSGFWKSVDRGQTWTKLDVPAISTYSHVATADGITVYYSCSSGVFRSTDGGSSWETLVNFPALSSRGTALDTPDGVTVYASGVGLGGVFVSYDAGETWTQIPGFGRRDYPSLAATKDGTVFHAGDGSAQKGTPAYASASTNAWTAVIGVSDTDMLSISDFALTMTGNYYVYCAFETAHDEFGIFSPSEYPLGWHTIAKKTDDIWHVRTTNGMVATSCTSTPEAITAAILTNRLNRTQYMSYSPIYGFSGFGGGLPVRMSATYLPYSSTNTPSVEEIRVLASAYSETKKWNTGAFDIRVISDDPPTTSVQWNGAEPTDATIYYSER